MVRYIIFTCLFICTFIYASPIHLAAQGLPVINVNELDSTQGFQMRGIHEAGRLGYDVSYIGDLNNDGLDDISISAPYASPTDTIETGELYIVFGRQNFNLNQLDINQLDGTNGFKIRGANTEDRLGYGGANLAGDINNDGIDDIIVTTPYTDPDPDSLNTGSAFVIFGKTTDYQPIIRVDTLSRYTGLRLDGTNYWDNFGTIGGYAGDLNGDSIDDFYVTADDTDFNGQSSGTVYIIYGKNTFPDTLDVDTLYQQHGFLINGGFAEDNVGISAGVLEDINGDGINDFSVGAFHAHGDRGAGYVVFGRSSNFEDTINVTQLNGSDGFQILGIDYTDFAGYDIGDAGDLNNDGQNDLYISAFLTENSQGQRSGKVHILYGTTTLFPDTILLENISAPQGFNIESTQSNAYLGNSVASVGDINGDDIDDLLTAAFLYPNNSFINSGVAHVIYGKNDSFPSDIILENMLDGEGLKLEIDKAYARLGFNVDGGGDFNGDGVKDYILGADDAGLGTGNAYLIYGKYDPLNDADNDGILNGNDECPDKAGEADCNGCPCLQLDLRVMLEGPLNADSSQMNTYLWQREVLPGQIHNDQVSIIQPYATYPWDYTGDEGDIYRTIPYPDSTVDWVLLSLRSTTKKIDEIARVAALLQKDGTIQTKINHYTVQPDSQSYHIVVEHRNHIGIMTPLPLRVQNNRLTYDFTQQNSYTNDNTGFGQKQITPTMWAMFAADLNQTQDFPSYDINGLDKALWSNRNGQFLQYLNADTNLDGEVNGQDIQKWIKNNGISSRVERE